jgi:diguanylate cyclase (GGDEF)-like protein
MEETQDETVVVAPDCTRCERTIHRVAMMIAEQRSSSEILSELCRQLGGSEPESQVAFLLLQGGSWKVGARGCLNAESESILALVDADRISGELLSAGAEDGQPFEYGWSRCLCSGTGELLGLFLLLHQGPCQPSGTLGFRIASACRLAAMSLEQRNLLDELAYRADHDPLTGLFNRSYYERLLAWRLKTSRAGNDQIALLYINLDRFRLVNDVMGHLVGNQLLKEVGRRFWECVGPGAIVARAGGDEFAVVLPQISRADDATDHAHRLLDSLAAPFSVNGHQLFVSASIGIGCSSEDSSPASLEREAYIALYQAKKEGKARAMHFHKSMASTPPERLEMEKRLRFALEGREMLLYYQPQVDLVTGAVTGAEVLLRWRAGELGIVSPSAFIPILEETGLIADFGRWVLREACRQGQEWAARTGSSLRLGVNVSALQFGRPDFVQDVERALAETGFPAEFLELELTESLFVGDFNASLQIFKRLQQTGVTFALDDFGTGQSALSYLHNLPFQRLKIDQSFIRPIQDRQELPPLVENIIRMAGALSMTTIAEGVETVHQAEVLRAANCREGQGYFWAKPLPPAEFAAYRARNAAECEVVAS